MVTNNYTETVPDFDAKGVHYTFHADMRVRQRGFSPKDVGLVIQYGEIVNDGYLLTSKAVEHRKATLKKELQRLDKLRNVAVIECSASQSVK